MRNGMVKSIIFFFFAALLTACVNKIGINTNFEKANFEIGKTTKSQVIDYFGLPHKMLKDDAGREHYFYEGAARLTGLCIGCGDVNGMVGVVPSLMNQSAVADGAEYIFDPNGVLVARYLPTER